MRRYIFVTMILLAIIASGCDSSQEMADELIEINLTKAWKSKMTIKLSELVRKVDYIKVQSDKECFMQGPQMRFFGQKHILFYDRGPNQCLLFNRDGSFKCKIGASGKGPGEYGFESILTMSKDESKVIISDWKASKVIIYNTEGVVLIQKNLSKEIKSQFLESIYCDFNDRITFMPRRPFKPVDGFASLVFFDFDLNRVGEVLPRQNDESLRVLNLSHYASIKNKNGTYFWEMYNDTVYKYNKSGLAIPKYHFFVEENGLTEKVMHSRTSGRELYSNYTFPTFIHFLPNLLCINSSGKIGNVFYNLETKESYGAVIENDIYGLHVSIASYESYYPDQDVCAIGFYWGDDGYYRNIDQVRNMKVKDIKLKDELLDLIDNPAEDQGPIILTLHMK